MYQYDNTDKGEVFLISNFRRVLYVVCFLLGNSPASEFYMPTEHSVCSIFISG
jgi:gamma-glutamylcysteine synthetase